MIRRLYLVLAVVALGLVAMAAPAASAGRHAAGDVAYVSVSADCAVPVYTVIVGRYTGQGQKHTDSIHPFATADEANAYASTLGAAFTPVEPCG